MFFIATWIFELILSFSYCNLSCFVYMHKRQNVLYMFVFGWLLEFLGLTVFIKKTGKPDLAF